MFKWIHHLLNPHCDACELQKHYLTEKLAFMLEQERAEKFRLLNLLAPSGNNTTFQNDAVDISTLRRNPKHVMREMERNSQLEAEAIRKRNSEVSIENLETEAGI